MLSFWLLHYILAPGWSTMLFDSRIRFWTFFSSSVDSIYPAICLHWGWLIWAFMVSILEHYFCKEDRKSSKLRQICYSWILMCYFTVLYAYRQASSTIFYNFYRSLRSSWFKVLPKLLWNSSILKLIFDIYVDNLNERVYRHWADSTLADSKFTPNIAAPWAIL